MTFRSSHIADIQHEGETLTVSFHNGKKYQYKAPRTVYDAFMQAPSKGKFFHRFVRRYRDGKLMEDNNGN